MKGKQQLCRQLVGSQEALRSKLLLNLLIIIIITIIIISPREERSETKTAAASVSVQRDLNLRKLKPSKWLVSVVFDRKQVDIISWKRERKTNPLASGSHTSVPNRSGTRSSSHGHGDDDDNDTKKKPSNMECV